MGKTLKISYGGTNYSLLKTSSKITTPSLYLDGGYIPCFQGNLNTEVLHGGWLYLLSPVKVNGYRAACGIRRENFTGNVYLQLKLTYSSSETRVNGTGETYHTYSANMALNGTWTSQNGFVSGCYFSSPAVGYGNVTFAGGKNQSTWNFSSQVYWWVTRQSDGSTVMSGTTPISQEFELSSLRYTTTHNYTLR